MQLPILMYHHLGPERSPIAIGPQLFEEHLARLHAGGYRVLPLGEALALWDQRPAPAERVAAMTFDDGYASVHQHALPALTTYGWRATVLPIGDFVGRWNDWPGQPSSVPANRLLDWSELHELTAAGWEIGGHTRTHPDLTRLTPSEIRAEVREARALLEDRLATPVSVFAYPYGCTNATVASVVRSCFGAACTTTMALARPDSDRHALERLEMWYFAQRPLDRLFLSPLMPPFVQACRFARAVRRTTQRLPFSTSRPASG